jgi:SAM-dependent methyltransferase
VGLFRQREPLPVSYVGPDAFFRARNETVQILRYEDDPVASIAVASIRGGLALLTNGKNDSALVGDYPTTALLGLLPALFAEKTERALVIGYGTGVTAGELAALSSTREVVVAEISRGVIHSAPLFDPGNLGASKQAKVALARGDAYRTLLRSEGRFDVIASEPSNPWVTGVEMLYSREFLEAARARLAPGGVFSQWVQLYDSDEETLALVLRTYAEVFDHVAVWYTLGIDLLLLGFDDPDRALDVAALEARAARPDFAAGLARAGVPSFPALLAHELLPLGVVRRGPGPVHSVLHPILADRAARAFFRGETARLPLFTDATSAAIGARSALFTRFAALHGAADRAAREAAAAEICDERPRECVAWVAPLRTAAPDPARLAERLAQADAARVLPESVDPDLLFWVSRTEAGTEPPAVDAAAARGLTRLFESFYTHPAPFSREALGRVWAGCTGDARACAEGRAAAERRLGPLGPARVAVD